MQGRVLVVDDEPNMVRILPKILAEAGFDCHAVTSGEKALEYIHSKPVDAVLTDVRMPGMDGMALLEKVKEIEPNMAVILMTAYGTVQQEVQAKKLGAHHYIRKPFENVELIDTITLALERRKLIEDREFLQQQLAERDGLGNFVGKSHLMQKVYDLILKVAPTNVTVLVTGETGTGKELAARAIHQKSPRAGKRFMPINCSNFSRDLLESELFGYEKGAFTDAKQSKRGLLEVADGGTVLLDEIGEMPMELQSKTLRVLESGEFLKVGSTKPTQVDIRLIASTHQDLKEMVKNGQFREDLFHRLNVMAVRLPPLRERKEDIPHLVQHFVDKFNKKEGRFIDGISPQAMKRLDEFDWPGNVRQLENMIQRASVLRGEGDIQVEDLPEEIVPARKKQEITWSEGGEILPYKVAKAAFERNYFLELLEKNDYNVSRSATMAGLSRRHLQEKLKQYNINRNREGKLLPDED